MLTIPVPIRDHTKLLNIGSNAHSVIDTFLSSKGQISGLCELDGSQLIPLTRIPAILTGKDADTLDGSHASDFAQLNSFLFMGG
jgi:hypothetical protein